MTSVLLIGLLSGCETTRTDGYCDIASLMHFDGQHVVDWLMVNDRKLLEGIVTHNEVTDRLC